VASTTLQTTIIPSTNIPDHRRVSETNHNTFAPDPNTPSHYQNHHWSTETLRGLGRTVFYYGSELDATSVYHVFYSEIMSGCAGVYKTLTNFYNKEVTQHEVTKTQ